MAKFKAKPGRPVQPPRVQFSLKIRPDLLDRLSHFAIREHAPRNMIIEQAIERLLDDHEGRSKS